MLVLDLSPGSEFSLTRSYIHIIVIWRFDAPFGCLVRHAGRVLSPNRRGRVSSKEIAMRRLFVMVAFGFGFYYLWNNTDTTVEWMAVGAMGVALLLEFAGAE